MWPNRMKDTLSKIGMLDTFIIKDRMAHTKAFPRTRDIFHQSAFADIKKETSKLRSYSTMKTQIGYCMDEEIPICIYRY